MTHIILHHWWVQRHVTVYLERPGDCPSIFMKTCISYCKPGKHQSTQIDFIRSSSLMTANVMIAKSRAFVRSTAYSLVLKPVTTTSSHSHATSQWPRSDISIDDSRLELIITGRRSLRRTRMSSAPARWAASPFVSKSNSWSTQNGKKVKINV